MERNTARREYEHRGIADSAHLRDSITHPFHYDARGVAVDVSTPNLLPARAACTCRPCNTSPQMSSSKSAFRNLCFVLEDRMEDLGTDTSTKATVRRSNSGFLFSDIRDQRLVHVVCVSVKVASFRLQDPVQSVCICAHTKQLRPCTVSL